MDIREKYSAEKEDVMRAAEMAGMKFIEHEDQEGFDNAFANGDAVYGEECVKSLLSEMVETALSAEIDGFARYASDNKRLIRNTALQFPEVTEALILCYKIGIARGSASCMNDLGALYYMGDLVGRITSRRRSSTRWQRTQAATRASSTLATSMSAGA